MKRSHVLAVALLLPIATVAACQSESDSAATNGTTEVVLPIDVRTATDVAVDADGNVYVTDAGKNQVIRNSGGFGATDGRIVRLDPGAEAATDVATEIGGPVALALGPDGSLYTADNTDARIVKVAADSHEQTVVPFELESSFPDDVTVDGDGGIYVLDSDSVLYLPEGSSQQTKFDFDDVGSPNGIAASAGGDLYILDSNYSDAAVWKLAEGTSEPEKLALTELDSPQAIAIDGDDNLYLLDSTGGSSGNRVLRYAAGETSPTTTDFSIACGTDALALAVGPDGDVYIADGPRVLRLTDEDVDATPPPTNSGFNQSVLPFTLAGTASGVTVADDGRLYVADAGAGSSISPSGFSLGGPDGHILRLDPGAAAATVLDHEVGWPIAVHITPSGRLYINNWFTQVVSITESSPDVTQLPFVVPEDAKVRGVVATPGEDLYALVELEDDTFQLQTLRGNATAVETLPVPVQKVDDMAVTDDGTVYVLDRDSGVVIWKLAPGAEPQRMRLPSSTRAVSLDVGPGNRIYVVNSPDGESNSELLAFDFGSSETTTITTFTPNCQRGRHDLAVVDDSTIYVTDDIRVLELTKE